MPGSCAKSGSAPSDLNERSILKGRGPRRPSRDRVYIYHPFCRGRYTRSAGQPRPAIASARFVLVCHSPLWIAGPHTPSPSPRCEPERQELTRIVHGRLTRRFAGRAARVANPPLRKQSRGGLTRRFAGRADGPPAPPRFGRLAALYAKHARLTSQSCLVKLARTSVRGGKYHG